MRQSRVLKRVTSAMAMVLATAYLVGCDIPSFLDQSEMAVYHGKKTLQKPILTSLSSIDASVDDPDVTFYNATDVKASIDNKVVASDYKIGVGDLVTISVNDLVGLGVETTKQTRVSESGNVSMPLLGQVKAVGLTEDELQKAIADAYKTQQIITNAQVTVTVAQALARTFQALGAVNNPGQFSIPQADFRMMDALVMMRDASTSIDALYIIRQVSEDPTEGAAKPATPGTPTPVTPAPVTPPVTPTGTDPLAPKGSVMGDVASSGANHAVFLQTGDPAGARGTTGGTAATPFQFGTPGVGETRTIRVPLDALRNGDLRYNIVIRPKDLIIGPLPPSGEYYLGGHIARGGVYNLPARGITLKQAILAAGGLDGFAIPQRTELIRRVGTNREVFVGLNLEAIFIGDQPDIYLKPNDILHVGTNIIAPFLAAIRGGFRITYGFGFLYDKNYAT